MEATAMVQLMTVQEARQCADQIRRGMADVRYLLLDFHEREGWRALNYESWRECAMTEFGYGQSHVYELLEAARIERNISATAEKPIPERHLRPLAKLEPDAQREVWQRATETAPQGQLTAKHVERTVSEWTYNQGVQYGAAASTYRPPEPEPEPKEDDNIRTVTLRVARVVYLLTMGKHMTLREIAEKTGLTENGAWRMMDRLAGGHHVPVCEYEGRWCILDVDGQEMPY